MHADNSTNGRSESRTLTALRVGFRIFHRIAPISAERRAAALFLTPRRRTAQRPDLRRAMNAVAPFHADEVAQSDLTLRVGSTELALTRWGRGPRILLVHGWSGAATDMATIGAALVRAGYEVLLPDLPAHGRSAGRTTSLVEWMWAIRAIVREFGGVEGIVAHSFGGAASALAMGELGVPARAVVLLAPAASPWHYVARFTQAVGLPQSRVDAIAAQIGRRVGRSPATLDPPRAAARIQAPALILHDPEDRDVPWAHGEAFAAHWPGARLEACPGTGHRRILRDAAVLAHVTGFLEEALRLQGAPPRGYIPA